MPLLTKYLGGTIYGFVEADGIYDTTQSLNDLGGNAAIARQGTYAAEHSRTQFGARNSRLGFKLKGPDSDLIKTSGLVEGDFLGNQPQSSPTPAAASPAPSVSESSYFTSPAFRMRHFMFRVETPWIDILAGQYWQLFGWQSMFHPNTVQMQGIPGQIYSRSPQFRVGKSYKTDDVTFEWALAASRPAQRNSGVPDGQAGVRFALNNFKALHTAGATGTALDGASIGLSTVGRYFRVPTYSASPTSTVNINGYGYSADLLLPVVPATNMKDGNALTITASYVYGQAIADYYTGLTGGASVPALATGTYPQDFDNGLLAFTPDGVLHAIRWTSYIVGAQYYFPGKAVWLAGNFSHMHSSDMQNLLYNNAMGTSANSSKLFDTSYWADGCAFVELNSAVKFGLEYAYYWQKYLDGTKGTNSRVQFSAFYVF
ncbi:MAG TPA: hypothetical protein VMT03_00280 [Polyangia bacterium]|nr:hypothetical protein [Polyangia bacterium]